MLTKGAGARMLVYLAIGFGVWLWLSQIGNDRSHDVQERRDILAAETALKLGDSSRALRARARTRASAKARAALEVVAAVVADTTPLVASSLVDSLFLANRRLNVGLHRVVEAALEINAARLIDSTRADAAEAELVTMRWHTTALLKRLEARRTFTVAFLTLPRPTKWQAALAGSLVGGLLDADDRLRGATVGGLGLVLFAPTR